MELHVDAGAILGPLTTEQRQRLGRLPDAAFADLLSRDVADRADVEALADAVVAFCDELAETDVGHGNGA